MSLQRETQTLLGQRCMGMFYIVKVHKVSKHGQHCVQDRYKLPAFQGIFFPLSLYLHRFSIKVDMYQAYYWPVTGTLLCCT